MITPSKPINDYYPVFLDMKEYGVGSKDDHRLPEDKVAAINAEGKLTSQMPDANELLKFASEKRLTEFQTLVLLIKNAFEGHAYLLCNLSIQQLMSNGTLFIEWNNQKLVDLTHSFHRSLHDYREGFHSTWELISAKDIEDPEFINELTGFIISSRLFKLPVSLLKDIPYNFLKKEPVLKQFYSDVAVSINKLLTEITLIETVNDLYAEAFSELLQAIEAKANCLSILDIKLSLVTQPEVRNEEDLQKSFTEYLVQSRGTQSGHTALGAFPEKQDSQMKAINARIGKIYKILSKSCSEIFNSGEESSNLILNDYFMEASKYYNSYSDSYLHQVMNYFRIIYLYFSVLNFRAYSKLNNKFENFLFIKETWLTDRLIEKLDTEMIQYKRHIEIEKHDQRTYFKIKNLSDDEMKKFHREFLVRKIKLLDAEITKTEKKIRKILDDK